MTELENISNLSNSKKIQQENKVNKNDKNKKASSDKAKADKADKTTKAANEKSVQDTVDISKKAKSYVASKSKLGEYKEQLEKINTLDKQELLSIHQNIENEKYSNNKVIEEVVNSLVENAEVGTEETAEAPSEPINDVEENTAQASEERLQEIRENIEEGKYDNEDVLDVVADNMLSPELF